MPKPFDIPTRKFERITSGPERVFRVLFAEEDLKALQDEISVKDVSLGGLGLKVPLGKQEFAQDRQVKNMTLVLPNGGRCVLNARILYKRLGQCGVEFDEGQERETGKIRAYMELHKKNDK